jgi:hypothetical protein
MSIPRLVVHENPEGRQTPLLLLAQLRELDPTVELVYFGARDWRLGAVRPTPKRVQAGVMILDNEEARAPEKRNIKNVYLARLLTQGFAQIAKYVEPEGGDISSTVLTEDGTPVTVFAHFERACFEYRKDQGASVVDDAIHGVAERKAQESKRVYDDYMATDGRAHFAREMRGRVTMGAGGFTGTSSALALNPTRRIITGEEVLADIAEIMRDLGGEVPTF